jgi:ribosomal protein L11 methylase PrmA
VDSLERAIDGVRWSPRSSWTSYYDDQASYAPESFAHKVNVVTQWLERVRPSRLWDLGANTGYFSKLSARQGALTLALDADPACVEALNQDTKRENIGALLPLVYDLTNPSPAIGWANEERMTLEERGPADMVVALALVHHVSIGNNVPLTAFADYLARLGRRAIVEFVPKSDPMAKRMLAAREDVFDDYTVDGFEHAFAARFVIDERVPLSRSNRVIYLMTAR